MEKQEGKDKTTENDIFYFVNFIIHDEIHNKNKLPGNNQSLFSARGTGYC